MPITETVCENCNEQPTAPDPSYCPNCGEGPNPWVEQSVHDFERDVDLPVIIEHEHYDDNYQLWYDFCGQVFGARELSESQIDNVPSGLPLMKYSTFSVYYKLDESLDLHGPFLDKSEARNA